MGAFPITAKHYILCFLYCWISPFPVEILPVGRILRPLVVGVFVLRMFLQGLRMMPVPARSGK